MIAIPMEKPKSCNKCPFTCEALQFFNGKDRPQSCPLIEIDLVTCGECKWGNKDNEGTLWCEHAIGGIMKPTDFCSYGERRNDER